MRAFSVACLFLIGALAAFATPITSLPLSAVQSPLFGPRMMVTPEPATIGMFAVGISVLALKLRRRK